jgi:3-deoxy-D-manno-octulosonate 8-phosphate phosphatase (KDO 8-P phosphatase)
MLSYIKKAAFIKLLLLDVDGVLTDGGIYYSDYGESLKRFNTLDGQGLKFLMNSGVEPVIISGRSSKALKTRLDDLGFTHVFLGVHNKVEVAEQLLKRLDLDWSVVASMGDDWPDLPMLLKASLSFAPPNAHQEIRKNVDYVTQSPSGGGAVREACDIILKAKGLYDIILNKYLNEFK